MKHFLIYALITSLKQSSSNHPARLQKKENSSVESFCKKACPYILIISLFILGILLFVALVKYGHAITGTEANEFYYHLNE